MTTTPTPKKVKEMTRREAQEMAMRAMLAKIEKLSLKDGDIVVVPDVDTMQMLVRACQPGSPYKGPNCPVIISPQGINTTTRKELEMLLESLPKESKLVLAN